MYGFEREEESEREEEREEEREREREREEAPLLVMNDMMEGAGAVELWRERLMDSPGLRSHFHQISPKNDLLLISAIKLPKLSGLGVCVCVCVCVR